jgi:RNA polymerase sigma-70 factor (ECF subfamily)
MDGVPLVADRAAIGDSTVQERFLNLVNAHQAVIHRIAWAYSTGRADHEDLHQEIVFQLWRSFPSYRRESSPITWMYRVALNTAITSARKRARRPNAVPIDLAGEPAAPPAAVEPGDIAALHRAIRQLSDVDRALVTCHLEELSYKRISEILGISETNVGARLTRVRAKLQSLIEGME